MSILRRGLSGAPVKRLQAKLGIDADGIFGPATEKAVKDFQKSAGIAVDGIVGPDTFTALGMPELILLRVGSRGAAVKKLQEGLGISADGIFGQGTRKAVMAFQEKNGLAVDGIAGPATLAKLDNFEDITEETVRKAVVTSEEKDMDGEPLPEIKGTEVVAKDGEGDEVAETSVWGKVKGWFS
jgi:murein L,D-transpeptidase YcbB/YkuD